MTKTTLIKSVNGVKITVISYIFGYAKQCGPN